MAEFDADQGQMERKTSENGRENTPGSADEVVRAQQIL
jgi:hypothetical protein